MSATHQATARNRMCADRIHLELWVEDGHIHRVAWSGDACAVCQRSAAHVCETLTDQSLESAETLLAACDAKERRQYKALPSRQSCALLPLQAVRQALKPVAPPSTPHSVAFAHHENAWTAAIAFRERGLDVAIATLIDVVGSSPCPLGSHLVVASSGEFWGAVSGGCVESAVVHAGQALLEGDRRAKTLSFHIANSQAGEVGLPCGGQIRVHLAPAPGNPRLRHYQARGRNLARVLDLANGTEHLDTVVHTQPVLEGTTFIEPLTRLPRLILVGGTRVAQVLSRLALSMGFEPMVVEPRPGFAGPGRFHVPVHTQPMGDVLGGLIHADTAVVMLTHDARIDDSGLHIALESPAFYIGALGSRKTQRARLERLADAGVPPARLARIRGPAGLAIGALGPEEIALSILAEVVARRRQRDPGRVGYVVLAAGSSKRAGTINKLLALIDDVPMIRRVVQTVLEVAEGPVIVVLGHEKDRIRSCLEDLPVQFVVHPTHDQGMGTSIAAGIRAIAIHEVRAAFVVLGDMPYLKSSTLQRLTESHTSATQHLVLAPVSDDQGERRRGNPVLWPRRYFDALITLNGDTGGKGILAQAPGAVLEIDVEDEGCMVDIDTLH